MGVEFEEDNFARKEYRTYAAIPSQSGDVTGMAGWLIRNGLARDAISANIFLIIVFFIILVFAFYVFKNGLILPMTNKIPVQPAPFPVLETL